MGRRGAFLFFSFPFRSLRLFFLHFVRGTGGKRAAVWLRERLSRGCVLPGVWRSFCLRERRNLLQSSSSRSFVSSWEEENKGFCLTSGVVFFFFFCRTSKNKSLIVFVGSDFLLLSLLGFVCVFFLFCLGLQFHLLPPAGRS
jgi:hypothetical protein